MSGTKSSGSTDTPAKATTVEQASDAIAGILARADGEPDDTVQGGEGEDEPDQGDADDAEGETQGDEEESEEPDADGEDGTDEEGEEPDEPPAAAKTITIEIDDKTFTLTAEEVRNGYLRTADYTRKTTALAEERRAFHGEVAAVQTERQQYSVLLNSLQQQLHELMPQEPEWDRLSVEDPVEFSRLWAVKQLRDEKLFAIQTERQRLDQMNEVQKQQARNAVLEAERGRLAQANPRWSDPAVWKKDRLAVRDYLLGYGYTDAEIGDVTDHRAVVIAHKARLYDEAAAKGRPVKSVPNLNQQQPQPAQRRPLPVQSQKPGTAPMRQPPSELTRDKMRLAKTHSVGDAAKVIARLI